MARRTLAQVIAEGDAIVLAKNNEIKLLRAKHQEELEVLKKNLSDDFVKYRKDVDALNYKIDSNHSYINSLEDDITRKNDELVKLDQKLHNSYVILGVVLVCFLVVVSYYFYKFSF
mgnify:FL=1